MNEDMFKKDPITTEEYKDKLLENQRRPMSCTHPTPDPGEYKDKLLANQRARIRDLETTVMNQDEALISARKRLTQSDEMVSNLGKGIESKQSEVLRVISEREAIRTSLKRTLDREHESNLLNQKLQNKISQLEQDNKTLEESNERFRKADSTLAHANPLATDYKNLERAYHRLQEQNTIDCNTIKDLRDEIESHHYELREKQSENNRQYHLIGTLKGEYNTLKDKYDSVYADVRKRYEAEYSGGELYVSLNHQLGEAKKRIECLERIIKDIRDYILNRWREYSYNNSGDENNGDS